MVHEPTQKASFVRRLTGTLALLLGVTLISFALTVYFGPDPTWELVGKNPTVSEIAQVRAELGLDRPFMLRYVEYLRNLATLELGHSTRTGEPVRSMLARSIPVTVMLIMPGFVAGLLLAIIAAMVGAWYRGRWPDRIINALGATSMSLSFVVVILVLQSVFAVGLGWFPARGWDVNGPISYLQHVFVPSLALIVVNLGYHLRFFRSVLASQIDRDHVRAARAFGAPPARIMISHVLANCWLAILTRILFTLPVMIVSGSLLLETWFGIPGVGRITYEAVVGGDQPVLMAIVSFSALLFAMVLGLTEQGYRRLDPRLAQP